MLRTIVLLISLLLAIGGCKLQVTGHSSSSTDSTVNGYTTSKRTSDGISRKLETGATIEIKDGTVTKFPKGALIKLDETGDSGALRAELRENEDGLELWIKEGRDFRRGSSEDEAWLKTFLRDFTTKAANP